MAAGNINSVGGLKIDMKSVNVFAVITIAENLQNLPLLLKVLRHYPRFVLGGSQCMSHSSLCLVIRGKHSSLC